MENFALINKEVDVNAYYFTNNQSFRSFPKQIEFDGTFVTFIESGLRFLIQSGQRLAELFDMNSTDGRTFRLRLENEHWTLVGVKGGSL